MTLARVFLWGLFAINSGPCHMGKEPVEPPLFDRLAEGVMDKLNASSHK